MYLSAHNEHHMKILYSDPRRKQLLLPRSEVLLLLTYIHPDLKVYTVSEVLLYSFRCMLNMCCLSSLKIYAFIFQCSILSTPHRIHLNRRRVIFHDCHFCSFFRRPSSCITDLHRHVHDPVVFQRI